MTRTRAAAASVLGIHPYTLKRWEVQGIVPEAQRDSAGRRLYYEHDMEKLKLIAAERIGAWKKRTAGE